MDRQELVDDILGKHREKHFKITNSLGVGDIFKMVRANNWEDIGSPVDVKLFHKVIRRINDHLAEELKNGNPIKFPAGMGHLEIRKRECDAKYLDGELKVTYPIDWKSTIDLWCDDEEARRERTLVRFDNKFVYKIVYDKYNVRYNNRNFYKFEPNRFIKRALTSRIREGKVDALWCT